MNFVALVELLPGDLDRLGGGPAHEHDRRGVADDLVDGRRR